MSPLVTNNEKKLILDSTISLFEVLLIRMFLSANYRYRKAHQQSKWTVLEAAVCLEESESHSSGELCTRYRIFWRRSAQQDISMLQNFAVKRYWAGRRNFVAETFRAAPGARSGGPVPIPGRGAGAVQLEPDRLGSCLGREVERD